MPSTIETYRKRDRYLRATENRPTLNYIDNWDGKHFLYCKKNKKRRAVVPLEVSGLKSFGPDASGELLAINFVVDAYESMNRFYKRNISEGTIEGLPRLPHLGPKRAYVKALRLYKDHLEDLKNIFFSNYLVPNRRKINTYDEFVKWFFVFVRDVAKERPIVYSSFVKSSLCPLHCTGLVVETLKTDHNINTEKYKRMLHQNYDYYANMAAGFGFVIPRHAPWMFIANLSSSALHSYAQFYDLPRPNHTKIINEYYYECKDFDIDLLREMLYDSYYEFFAAVSVRTDLEICKDVVLPSHEVATLRSLEEINNSYKAVDWLNFYIKVLMAENDIQIADSKYKSFFHECSQLYRDRDFEAALNFTEMRLLKKKTDIYR